MQERAPTVGQIIKEGVAGVPEIVTTGLAAFLSSERTAVLPRVVQGPYEGVPAEVLQTEQAQPPTGQIEQ